MKRKLTVAILALCVLLSVFGMTGCDSLLSTNSAEDIYSKLDSLISDPDGSTDLTGKISFVAYIITEPFEEKVDGETRTYQQVGISRNKDDVMFVDVSDLGTKLPAESYATITGTLDGHLFWTNNNKQEKVLNFHADKMESFTPSEEEPSTENKLSLETSGYSGEVEFVGAHYSKNNFGDVIVVYMNFTNTKPEGNVKFNGLSSLFGRVDLYHGEEYVEKGSSTLDPDELDPSALDATSMTAYTPTGKTQLYYMIVKVGEEGDNAPAFGAEVVNDEFACTNFISIPIANSLAEMNK